MEGKGMRRVLFLLAVSVLAVACASSALACGDKFLVGNSAANYQGSGQPIEPGTIAIYVQGGGTADWDAKAESLESEGHTVLLVENADELIATVGQGGVDVVMIPVDEARARRQELAEAAPQAVMLPYIEFGTRSEIRETKKEFGRVLQTPATEKKVHSAVYKSLAQSQP